MIAYKNRFLSFGVVFYDEVYAVKGKKIDVIREDQFSRSGFFSHPCTTMHLDLSRTESEIFDGFEKNTKYEIHRASSKDNLVIEDIALPEGKKFFLDLYAEFATGKGLPRLESKEIDLLINTGQFCIRGAFTAEKHPLVVHTYILSNGRARLAHSVSLFRETNDSAIRNITGRANRLLHWEDIRYFKHLGYKIYDLGGINPDKKNVETQSINKFKECFGGTVIKEFNSIVPITFKGFLFAMYKKLMR